MKMIITVVSAVLLITFMPFYAIGVAATDEAGADSPVLTDIRDSKSGEKSYETYLAAFSDVQPAVSGINTPVNAVLDQTAININISVPTDGLYKIGMEYRSLDNKSAPIKVALTVNGKTPYDAMNRLEFPRMWTDNGHIHKDGLGNEIPMEQLPYDGFYTNYAIDNTGWSSNPYLLALTAGNHTLTMTPVFGNFELKTFLLGALETIKSYEKPSDVSSYYNGEPVILEGEKAWLKSSFWITAKSDSTTNAVSPSHPEKALLNYIGGNWKTTGESVVWKTPKLKPGFYQIGFSYRQNTMIGSSAYRDLNINGKTPFKEAATIDFPYGNVWKNIIFEDEKNKPYLVYLNEGINEISLTVTLGGLTEVCDLLRDAVSELGSLYMDIVMITGESVDIYRDYDLFNQLPDMEERLNLCLGKLYDALDILTEVTGHGSGSHASVIKSMVQICEKMLENEYNAHRYKNNYYNSYCSLSATLSEMRDMPLDIDRIILTKPDGELPMATGIFSKLAFSVRRVVTSFFLDYNNISGLNQNAEDSVDIWVNWGQDQAQVLNVLNQKFTEKTGIQVNLKIVNATVVQAVLSGKGPNVMLHHSRSEPVNLAIRGVLRDLKTFPDCNEVLGRFMPGAEAPYRYKDGLYALPDTQTFFMMYYRKDIFEKFKLEAPRTWDEFAGTVKTLARNNLDAWLPYTQLTALTQANTGVGSLSIFPSLVMQNGLSLYTSDNKGTTLLSPAVIEVFSKWTEYYTKLKLPVTLSFYNRFRIGTCPIGIEPYTLYNTLKAAAPEIDGLWGMLPIPGTAKPDGSVDHTSSGGGTSCAIMKSTAQKEDAAWEYLKWWTSAETQIAYSTNIESILGPTGRVSVATVDALLSLSWEDGAAEQIEEAWRQVREVPEVPGSYYLSRSVDHSFWNVVNSGRLPKDMLNRWGMEVDNEIVRKWKQYENRQYDR